MKWQKKGIICTSESFDIPWYKKNTMVPVPYLLNSKCLRIYIAMCDDQNIARIGYVDVDPENPSIVLGCSTSPVLDIGESGTFSECGVLPSSIIEVDGSIYLYYSAYQKLSNKIPYTILSGLAVSDDGGHSFKNLTRAPILDRTNDELFVRAAPVILKEKDFYRVFYIATVGDGWVATGDKMLPSYEVKQFTTHSLINWNRERGECTIPLSRNADEYGISRISVWLEDCRYKVLYAIRSLSNGCRLGYAESFDGINFERKDELVGIDVSDTGWDSEMITFPERYSHKDRTFLFYCGNHYGMAGMGYAELIDKD